MAITDGYCDFWQVCGYWKGGTVMKKIAAILAGLAFTTGMAVVTVVAHTDRAMADSAGTAIVYPEQASKCNETNC
jgi:hypothetical protein